jgi:nicotinamide N-methyltransferase
LTFSSTPVPFTIAISNQQLFLQVVLVILIHKFIFSTKSTIKKGEEDAKFNLILLADLLFNRSEHEKLLRTVRDALAPGGTAWVAFSHHDPQKAAADLRFFSLASDPALGLLARRVGQVHRPSYPFTEHDGLDNTRGVVHVYTLTRCDDESAARHA